MYHWLTNPVSVSVSSWAFRLLPSLLLLLFLLLSNFLPKFVLDSPFCSPFIPQLPHLQDIVANEMCLFGL